MLLILRRASPICPTAPAVPLLQAAAQVLRYNGPDGPTPGGFDKCVVQLDTARGNPWDLKIFQQQLIVTVHSGSKRCADARILVLHPEPGAALKCIQSKLFSEPNMMALE